MASTFDVDSPHIAKTDGRVFCMYIWTDRQQMVKAVCIERKISVKRDEQTRPEQPTHKRQQQ